MGAIKPRRLVACWAVDLVGQGGILRPDVSDITGPKIPVYPTKSNDRPPSTHLALYRVLLTTRPWGRPYGRVVRGSRVLSSSVGTDREDPRPSMTAANSCPAAGSFSPQSFKDADR
ncbi:hypothetical protein Prum_072910 [Phytohabitans rumicis]|uniref:Uncharacterized protein n=1 Tax=Phytohabitans rumicis TaxID=1076125 RepID=A0A6V8LGC3_9ACTN|nr:hypothetical protein Prum_072910 [Phytohabitans rumicis]